MGVFRTAFDFLRQNKLAAASLVPELWRLLSRAINRLGDIDFLVERAKDPGWIGAMLRFLADPPPYFTVPLMVVGLMLIYRNVNRRSKKLTGPEIMMAVSAFGFFVGAILFYFQNESAPSTAKAVSSAVEKTPTQPQPAKASQSEPSKPKPYYSSTEIEAMLGVLRKWTITIDKKIEPGHAILREELYQWEQKLKFDNLQQKIDAFAKARDIISEGYADLRKELQEDRSLSEQLAPVIAQKPDVLSGMDSALRNAMADLQDLKQHPGIDVVKFARPALQRLQALDGGLGPWIEKTRAAILKKTAELREWRNP